MNDFYGEKILARLEDINASLRDLASAIRESRTPPRFFDPSVPPPVVDPFPYPGSPGYPPAPGWPVSPGPSGFPPPPVFTCEAPKIDHHSP